MNTLLELNRMTSLIGMQSIKTIIEATLHKKKIPGKVNQRVKKKLSRKQAKIDCIGHESPKRVTDHFKRLRQLSNAKFARENYLNTIRKVIGGVKFSVANLKTANWKNNQAKIQALNGQTYLVSNVNRYKLIE